MAAWKLPLIVAAITLPIVGSFVIAGPPAGFAAGALGVVVLLVIAARRRRLGPIGELPSDGRHHLLVVVAGAIEEPSAVRELTAAARLAPGGDAEARRLAPARV